LWHTHNQHKPIECTFFGLTHTVNVMVITFHETNNFIKNSIVYYNCDFLLEQMPVQSKVNDIGDLTLLVSNQFNENFSGASISKYKRNNIYFSKAFYGGKMSWAIYCEIIHIGTDARKSVVCPRNDGVIGSSMLVLA
jgi:hypothetical protein